jgi:hypothetical protein
MRWHRSPRLWWPGFRLLTLLVDHFAFLNVVTSFLVCFLIRPPSRWPVPAVNLQPVAATGVRAACASMAGVLFDNWPEDASQAMERAAAAVEGGVPELAAVLVGDLLSDHGAAVAASGKLLHLAIPTMATLREACDSLLPASDMAALLRDASFFARRLREQSEKLWTTLPAGDSAPDDVAASAAQSSEKGQLNE